MPVQTALWRMLLSFKRLLSMYKVLNYGWTASMELFMETEMQIITQRGWKERKNEKTWKSFSGVCDIAHYVHLVFASYICLQLMLLLADSFTAYGASCPLKPDDAILLFNDFLPFGGSNFLSAAKGDVDEISTKRNFVSTEMSLLRSRQPSCWFISPALCIRHCEAFIVHGCLPTRVPIFTERLFSLSTLVFMLTYNNRNQLQFLCPPHFFNL